MLYQTFHASSLHTLLRSVARAVMCDTCFQAKQTLCMLARSLCHIQCESMMHDTQKDQSSMLAEREIIETSKVALPHCGVGACMQRSDGDMVSEVPAETD